MGAFSSQEFKPTINFNARIAYACGLASYFAYRDEQEIKRRLQNDGFVLQDFRFFNDPNTDTQAFVAADDEKVIVSFRGTEGSDSLIPEDAKTDANIILTDSGHGGSVHFGFMQALVTIWDGSLKNTIDRFSGHGSKYVYFTGHSLGGALATLAAFFYVNEGGRTPHVYTFGCPRVGNPEFAKSYNRDLKRTTFRYVNDMDVVVYMPPEDLGYAHVGYGVYFDNKGGVSTRVSYFERVATRMVQYFERDMVGFDSEWVNDHDMGKEYVPNLRQHVDTRLSFKGLVDA